MTLKAHNGERFIFVGGVPRSGTSLVQKVLDLHPNIYGGPEFDHFPNLMRNYENMLNGIKNGRQKVYYDESDLKNIYAEFISKLLIKKAIEKKRKYISEKTPDNILAFSSLKQLFPLAKFVWVVRDPRAIINSFINVKKSALKVGVDLKIGLNPFIDLNRINKSILAGYKFYQNNLSSCYIIYYENLVNEPVEEINKLCKFLNIKYTSKMLSTNKSNDGSKLTDDIWYTKEQYDRIISTDSNMKWEKELPVSIAKLTEDYFARQKYSVFSPYSLKQVSVYRKFLFIPIYLKNYGYKKAAVKFLNKIRYLIYDCRQ